jgi:hypothetical protein
VPFNTLREIPWWTLPQPNKSIFDPIALHEGPTEPFRIRVWSNTNCLYYVQWNKRRETQIGSHTSGEFSQGIEGHYVQPWLLNLLFRREFGLVVSIVVPFFFTEVFLLSTCRKQFCLFWLPWAVDFKVSCSQILRRAFVGIRTHDPLVESDVLTIRPRPRRSINAGGVAICERSRVRLPG